MRLERSTRVTAPITVSLVLFALAFFHAPPAHALGDLWVASETLEPGQPLEIGWTFSENDARDPEGQAVAGGGRPLVSFDWYYLPEPAPAGGVEYHMYGATWGDGQVGGGNDLDGPDNGTFRTVFDDFMFPPGTHRFEVSDYFDRSSVLVTVLPATSGRLLAGKVTWPVDRRAAAGDPSNVRLVVAQLLEPEAEFGRPREGIGVSAVTDTDGNFEIRLPEDAGELPLFVALPGEFDVNFSYAAVAPDPLLVCGGGDRTDLELEYEATDTYIEVGVSPCWPSLAGRPRGPVLGFGERVRVTATQIDGSGHARVSALVSMYSDGGVFEFPVRPGEYVVTITDCLPRYFERSGWYDEDLRAYLRAGDYWTVWAYLTPTEWKSGDALIHGELAIQTYGGDGKPGGTAPLPWTELEGTPAGGGEDAGYCGTPLTRTASEADGSFELPGDWDYFDWSVCTSGRLPEDYKADCIPMNPKEYAEVVLGRRGNPLHPTGVAAEPGVYFDRLSWEAPDDPLVEVLGYYIERARACPGESGPAGGGDPIFEFDFVGWVPAGVTEFRACAPEPGDYYYTVAAYGDDMGSSPNELAFIGSPRACVPVPFVEPIEGRTITFASSGMVSGMRAAGPASSGGRVPLEMAPVRHWPLRSIPGEPRAAGEAYTVALAEGWNVRGAGAAAAGPGQGAAPGSPLVAVRRTDAGDRTGAVRLQFDLAARADVSAEIFDVTGRRVGTLSSGVREAGSHMLEWDRLDAAGAPVAHGLYFLSLRVDGARRTVKVPIR